MLSRFMGQVKCHILYKKKIIINVKKGQIDEASWLEGLLSMGLLCLVLRDITTVSSNIIPCKLIFHYPVEYGWGDLLRSILLKNINFKVNITQEEHVFGKFRLLRYTEVWNKCWARLFHKILFKKKLFISSAVTPSQSVFLVSKDEYLFGFASGPYVVMCYALLNPL